MNLSFVLSPIVHNTKTSKEGVISTGHPKRGNKGPFCGPNGFNNFPQLAPVPPRRMINEAEIVLLLPFCDNTKRVTPFLLVFFYSLRLHEKYILRRKNLDCGSRII